VRIWWVFWGGSTGTDRAGGPGGRGGEALVGGDSVGPGGGGKPCPGVGSEVDMVGGAAGVRQVVDGAWCGVGGGSR
jgi:hypothetical protein